MRLFSSLLILIIIILPDGSDYIIDPVRTDGRTWVWAIYQGEGKDLSHWVLDMGPCNGKVVSAAPVAEFGTDPTTGATGYKFEPIIGRITLYTVTLDSIYPHGHVTATMKAGALGNYASGFVTGPDCGDGPHVPTPVPVLPTLDPTATADAGTIPPVATVTPTATAIVTGESGGSEPLRWRWWLPWVGGD